jgi:tetratricopeptide (TPR) repeat protein
MQTNLLVNQIYNALKAHDAVGAKFLLEKLAKFTKPQNLKDYWSCKYMLADLQKDRYSLLIALKNLYKLLPNDLQILDLLANYYAQNKQFADAASCYEKDFLLNPKRASSAYNCAYYFKLDGKYLKSISYYKSALTLDITSPEEVLLNMAVIYSEGLQDEKNAENCLKQAIALCSSYIPAMLNLANLYEQKGDRAHAKIWLNNVLAVEPEQPQALARLVDLNKFTSGQEPLLVKIRRVVTKVDLSLQEQLDLHFALGKSLDQCGLYHDAFEHYYLANNLNKKIVPVYQKNKYQDFINNIIHFFSNEFLQKFSSNNDYQPIFICGMFRSGTSLVEQILSSHSQVAAGGELDFFVRLVAKELNPFPASLEHLPDDFIKQSALEYQRFIAERFNDANFVIDKRPDNFQYVGLIKTLFPDAKIIHTQRTMMDNCLSVYFQQLGAGYSYATDMTNIVHYYQQQQKLMEHWKNMFPNDIHTIHYEQLVKTPREEIHASLAFLNLPWEDECLSHHKNERYVKTASVWQVREPINERSLGRSKNYAEQLAKILKS